MYDKVENKQLSRRERVLLDPLKASKEGVLKEQHKEPKEGSFYGYNEKTDNFYPGLDD
jgi:hypothetical protein